MPVSGHKQSMIERLAERIENEGDEEFVTEQPSLSALKNQIAEMSASGHKRSMIERLAQRESEGAEGLVIQQPSKLSPLKNHIAAAAITSQQGPPPAGFAHIDLARLQEAGMVTPVGGRGRVLDEYRLIKRPIIRYAVSGTDSHDKRRNLVMVTSAQPDEGKTFTAICLAMSVVAEENVQVLLVDLDIHSQQLCRTLGIRDEMGLVNLLHGTTPSLSEVLVQTDVPRLTVLPAGSDHPLAHELLAGPKMRSLMGDISNRYRDGLVIFDTAPALVSTDTSVLAMNVGQVIMVVEANRTGRASVEEAVSLVNGCDQISFVLNGVAASELIEQYGSYYGDRYDRGGSGGVASLLDRLATYIGRRSLRSHKAGSNS
jgi:protein-tyrosine kinase